MAETFPEPYAGAPLTTESVVVKDSAADLKDYPERFTAGGEDLAEAEIRVTAPAPAIRRDAPRVAPGS